MFIAAIVMLERSDVVKRPLHLIAQEVVPLFDKMTTMGVPLLLHPSVLHFCLLSSASYPLSVVRIKRSWRLIYLLQQKM